MSNIPVDRMISILEIFRAQIARNSYTGMNKNQIIRSTGVKNKGPILRAINLLVKDNVLDSKKVDKQKELITLAPLGQEIIDLIIDINIANEAHTTLELKIAEYEDLIKKKYLVSRTTQEDKEYEKILKRKLIQKGWKDEELESFEDVLESAYRIEGIYRKNICNSIFHRYSLIVSEFEIKDNTMEVLMEIILKQIAHLLSLKYYNFKNNLAFEFLTRFDNLGSTIDDEIYLVFHLGDIYGQGYGSRFTLLNRFISKEALKLMTSLLSIIKLHGIKLRDRLIDTGDHLKSLRRSLSKLSENDVEGKKSIKLRILAVEQLRQIYGNYVVRYQRYLKEKDDEAIKLLYEAPSSLSSLLEPSWETILTTLNSN